MRSIQSLGYFISKMLVHFDLGNGQVTILPTKERNLKEGIKTPKKEHNRKRQINT